VSYQVVLTKIDKIKPPALAAVLRSTADELSRHGAAFPLILATSSQTGAGIAELRAQIAQVAGA
jgi:GTP-binding protein